MRRYALLVALAALMSLIAQPALAYVIDDSSSTASEPTEGEVGEVIIDEEPLPEPTPLPPTKRTEQVFFACGATKADNVNRQQGQVPTWDTTAPTQSVQAGAGCGFFDGGIEKEADQGGDGSLDAIFRGTFAGNLDNLSIELHRIHGATDRAYEPLLGSAFLGDIWLKIDGQEVPLAANDFETPTVPSESGVSQMIRLSITNLGLMVEEGDGTTVRTIELRVGHYYSDTEGVWVWDTTEVPSGITFNPATLEATKISVA